MNAAEVPEDLVEKAMWAVAGEQPVCAECGENGPAACVYCKDDAEKYARHALAAVLPEVQAQARREAERERDAALVERDEMRRMALSVSQSARRIASSPRLRAAETERTS